MLFGAKKFNFSSALLSSISSFPFVSVEEVDNYVDELGADSCELENYDKVAYELNIITQGSNSKEEAKLILAKADEFMKAKGFVRISKNHINADNGENDTKFRYIARYKATVGKDLTIYRR